MSTLGNIEFEVVPIYFSCHRERRCVRTGADLLASFPTDFGTTFAFPRFLFRERNSFSYFAFFFNRASMAQSLSKLKPFVGIVNARSSSSIQDGRVIDFQGFFDVDRRVQCQLLSN